MKLKPNCLSLSCIYSCIGVGFNYDIFISLYQFFFLFNFTGYSFGEIQDNHSSLKKNKKSNMLLYGLLLTPSPHQ